ncbi:hypothetical protein CROQUDRAFT_87970 [Cronartium quercuum f. sp. fusiforme G11]|uniref:Uncharacterized protein n=1 Tax=Cronartium quercuum f. sp. fusiforme G11 TaxID=708437 RepID=A0A9P6NQQ7_9BASI|nr:hypothetical protein CROQUDRAFT_87970 [Cronartium quercuum f. sp. fusiforme G11]
MVRDQLRLHCPRTPRTALSENTSDSLVRVIFAGGVDPAEINGTSTAIPNQLAIKPFTTFKPLTCHSPHIKALPTINTRTCTTRANKIKEF